MAGSSPPLYPWRKEQGNGNAQLALEVRKLQRFYPNDYLRHQAKEVRDRLKREQTTHLGTDLLEMKKRKRKLKIRR